MYQEVGEYKGSLKPLLDLLTKIAFTKSKQGYLATNAETRDQVIKLFKPKLSKIFPGEWRDAMITSILPMGMLPPHKDGPRPGTRYHLVLQTNDMSWCMHDKVMQHLDEGKIYTIDQTVKHGAINWGDTPRIHLVVDVE